VSVSALSAAITAIVSWFNSKQVKYCLVGGLAVSFRTIERATRDVDLALGVTSDEEAEVLIRELRDLGFAPVELLQRRENGAISTVRLLSADFAGIYLDLLFCACGIEWEIVHSAENIEILPGLEVPTASLPALVAMKVLSSGSKGRRQDLLDLEHLISDASASEILEAEKLIQLMVARGFGGTRDLLRIFADLVAELRDNTTT
jgi:hypothetical protein